MNTIETELKQAYTDLLSGIKYREIPITLYTNSAGAIKRPCIIIGAWVPKVGKPTDLHGQFGEVKLEIVSWGSG